ncbi:MAG: hypothetical protein J6V90_04110 [Treponema sp.]|nr:hypothetical protein [Treponema sp.]
MKKKFVIKTAALLLAACVFVSCSGLTDSGPSFVILPVAQPNSQQGAASTSSHKTVIFSGAISSGALPKAIAKSISSNAGKNGGAVDGVSASASPDITDSEYYYYVKTTCQETGAETEYDQGDPVFISGSSSIAFEVPLVTGYTWVIECGFKKTGLADPVLFDQTKPIPLDDTTSVISASFVARPNPAANGGKGSVLLDLSGSYKTATISCSDDGWKTAVGAETAALDVDPVTGLATLNLPSVKAGAYQVTFSFYNSDSVMVYQTAQMISVLAGMQTNSWIRSPGDDENVINDDLMFMVGEQAMQAFDRRTFYVGQSMGNTMAANTNAGTAYAPFGTFGAAVKAILARGSASETYNIYISGEVNVDPNDASLFIPSDKAKSVVISGIHGVDENGNPKDTIKGVEEADSILNLGWEFPVHLKNLRLQGAPGFATKYGVYFGGNVDCVYLDSGVLITGCQHGVCAGRGKLVVNGAKITGNKALQGSGEDLNGAGVWMDNGTEFEMRAGAITGNTAGNWGGGIFFEGNSFYIKGGEISGNMAKKGAGLYWHGSNHGNFVREISGGKIFQNEASEFGGGILISRGAALLSITGAEIYQNTAAVTAEYGPGVLQPGGGAICMVATPCSIGQSAYIPYGDKNASQAPGKNDISFVKDGSWGADSPLVIQSPLSRHSLAAPIALTPNWERGWQLYKSDSASLTLSETDKFLLTDDSWEKKYSEDEKTAMVDSPIYVGSYNGSLGNDTTNDGSKTQPFRTLARACQEMDNANVDYTIKLSGSTYQAVPGGAIAQEIPSTLLNTGSGDSSKNYARSVTISGYGDGATINRGAAVAQTNGYALKISSAVPVILTKVTVTGGHNSENGGGIIVEQGATLCLGKGTKVIGNKTEDGGGGIYSKGKVFVYGDAKIGERDETNLTDAKYVANQSYYSNWANGCGGGICLEADALASVAGELYLGYYRDTDGSAKKDESFTGGIFYNYSELSGGAIYVRGYAAKKAKLAVTGGTIAYNAAYVSGGGIYTAGTVDLDAGTIKENEANFGGAIIQKSDSNIKFNGSLSIPYGDGTLTKPWNDIYVSNGKLLALGSGFTSSDQILLAPETESGVSFKRRKVFSGTTNMSKFDLTIKGFKLDSTVAAGYGSLMLKNIVTTIYVASTVDSGDNRTGNKGSDPSGNTTVDATWNSSTYEYNGATNNSAKPFATIAKAAQFITYQESPSTNYTIYVDGTLVGAQSLANSSDSSYPVTLDSATATKITLASKNGLDASKNPKDILNGNNNRTLNINASVPIHILALGITGGSTSGNGGGICIATPGTSLSVTLGDGTDANGPKIYGNHAYCGGGVYCGTNTSLAITKGARITENYADKGSGNYKYGGGIYTEGTRLDMTGGEISYNQVSAWGSGGGVYSDAVFVMTGGTIKGNRAAFGGGLLNKGQFYMSGSAIIGTELPYNAWAEADTQDANIAEKRTINSSANGGDGGGIRISDTDAAVYIGYTLGNGGVVSKAAFSDDGKKYGVVTNYAHGFGGGIDITQGQLHVAAGDVSNNKAAHGGGGISCSHSSQFFELDGSSYKVRLERNQCETDVAGGAIYFYPSDASVNLTMKGTVEIPGGAGVRGNNDIYFINAHDNHIAVAGALTDYYCVTASVIEPTNPNAKYKILDVTSDSGQVTQKAFKRFSLTNENAYIDSQGYVREGYIVDSFTVGASKTLPADIPSGSTLVVTETGTGLKNVIDAIKKETSKQFKVDLTRMNQDDIQILTSDLSKEPDPAPTLLVNFDGCTNIVEVAFDGEKLRPRYEAFKGCSKLETVKVINKAMIYGNAGRGSWATKAFDGCSRLTTFDFTECTNVQVCPGTIFSSANNTVEVVKLGSMLETLYFSNMTSFAKNNFKLTYDGSANNLKNNVTTTQGHYDDPGKTITCQCASGGNLTWSESTSGPWQP